LSRGLELDESAIAGKFSLKEFRVTVSSSWVKLVALRRPPPDFPSAQTLFDAEMFEDDDLLWVRFSLGLPLDDGSPPPRASFKSTIFLWVATGTQNELFFLSVVGFLLAPLLRPVILSTESSFAML